MGISTISIGKVKFNWRGNWAAATAYAKDDVVKYGPSVYTITEAHTSASTFAANIAKTSLMVEGVTWADTYSNSTLYQVNDIVGYGGAIYICLQEGTNQTPSSASAYWDRLVGGLEWEGLYSAVASYQKGDIVRYGGHTYTAIQDSTGNTPTNTAYWEVLNQGYNYTGTWGISESYRPGDVVKQGGILYAANVANGGIKPPAAQWDTLSEGTSFVGVYNNSTTYSKGEIVTYGGNQYLCIANSAGGVRPADGVTSSSFWVLYSKGFNFRSDYTASTSYNPGDVVKYGGRTYLCVTDFIFTSTEALPTNTSYWVILNKGLNFVGNWSASGVDYKLDDIVEYSASSYVCIQAHTSSGAFIPNASPLYWTSLAQGDSFSPMTTTGDMIYRNSVGATVRLPIGPSGATLVVNNGIPSWGVQAPEQNYYVSKTGNDSNDGRTPATAWRTLQHACTETFNLGQSKISIFAGTYTELCPIKVGRGVVIEGDGLGAVTISPEVLLDKGYGVGISKDGSTPNANSEVFHVNNAARIRNIVFRGFSTGAVCVSLDPGTGPNDTTVWITSQSPYVQNCTSFTDGGTGMVIDGALHNGGYKSIVANDWTQINSDGYGMIVKNDGRSELVSCFTYYCTIGYLAESGGKIRAVGGNNSYGTYGSVARGYSQNEVPLSANLQLSDDTINSIVNLGSNVHTYSAYKDFNGNTFYVGHTNPTDSGYTGSATWSNSSSRPFIAKFDETGSVDWIYTYESSYGTLTSVVEFDDQIYCGGTVYNGGSNKGFLLKLNQAGEIGWQKYVASTDSIVDLTTDGSSYLYAVGNNTTYGATVVKVLPSGIISWSRALDYNDSSVNTLTVQSICYAGTPTTSVDSYANEGDATAEDNLYIACRDTTANQAMIVRMTNTGALVNAYKYGDLTINKLRLDTGNGDGIYMVAGGYYDPVGTATKNAIVMRVDILGNVEWQKQYSETLANSEILDVLPFGDDVYIVGYANDTDSSNSYNKGFVSRLTSNGTTDWNRIITSNVNEIAFTGVALDGVNVITAGPSQFNSAVVNIQRDLVNGIGTVTSGNWILATYTGTTSTDTVATKSIQNVYLQTPSLSLSDATLTLNQSPTQTRTISATRAGFAGIGTGVNFTVSGLTRQPKEGSVIHITGDSETYFCIGVANYSSSSGTAEIAIDPPIPSNKTPDDNTAIVFREAFSQVRMTSHDFLDIGTGGFASTNYPVIIRADYTQQPSQINETVSENGGRCFYVTTDQDGNFRVGDYFKVEQATGRSTINAQEFNLSGLNELQLGSITAGRQGATVNEFSTDGTFSDNSDTAVPTERATKTYVDNEILAAVGAASKLKVGLAPNESKVEVTGTGTVTDTVDVSINGTQIAQIGDQYIKIPAGNTASRPISPSNGYIRYNTDTASFEGYANSQWSGIGGGNPWATKTGSYTATNNDRLFVDTSGGAVTITLPLSPAVGDSVRFIDVAGSFNTNNLTVARNGSKIMGLTENLTENTQYSAFGLVYSGSTYGWVLIEV